MNKRKNCIAAAIIIAGVMMVGCNPIETRIDMISLDVAKEVALKDAGIVDERIVFTTSRLDAKNEKEYYDIDFFANGYKYEYDIDALTGIVIEAKKPEVKLEEESTYTQEDMEEIQEHIWEEYDKQQEKIQETLQKIEEVEAERLSHSIADSKASEESDVIEQSSYEITEEQAKEIALTQVPGADLENIYEFEVDYDDGRIAYEGKIIYGEMEYDFEIDGYSGAIRDWDAESIYD